MPPPEPVLAAEGVRARLLGARRDAVRDVSLHLSAGRTLALLGPSGSGKSTLALALLGAIPGGLPGEVSGVIRRPRHAAAVLQDTDAHLVALIVEDEIAFALENRGLPPKSIEARIEGALARPPARGLDRRDRTLELSGGWRQRLAIAAALAEAPPLLVMDEPFAHLAAEAADEAAASVANCIRAGAALLLVEHRAEQAARLADHVLVLGRDGAPALAGPAAATLYEAAGRADLPLRLTAAIRAGRALTAAGLLSPQARPLDPDSLVAAAGALAGDFRARMVAVRALGLDRLATPMAAHGPPLLAFEGVSLGRGDRTVLREVDLAVRSGEVLGVAGRNGAGKTSLALLAAGGLKPSAGAVTRSAGRWPSLVPQNPNLAFATHSLAEEARRRGLPWPVAEAAIEAAGLLPDRDRHPLALSHGERRRLALALAFAEPRPGLTILDEPGSGLDQGGLESLSAEIGRLAGEGSGVIVVAHDLDWLAQVSDRIAVIESGRIAALGPPDAILRQAIDGRLPIKAPEGAALAARLGWRPEAGDARAA